MRRINLVKVFFTFFPVIIAIIWFTIFANKNEDISSEIGPTSKQGVYADVNSRKPFDPNHKIVFPLVFPIKDWSYETIKQIPESRFPGASRVYRGAGSKHMGMDIYTGKCDLEVIAPSSGWVLDVTLEEQFPDSETRDALLQITEKCGFSPEPLLDNLHGISIVIFHGWDENGTGYYSRMSHFEQLSSDYMPGDFVNRGELVGYVGATGTSAQFRSKALKEEGCHLHFEWHMLKNGKDIIPGLEESNFSKKRDMYLKLFTQ